MHWVGVLEGGWEARLGWRIARPNHLTPGGRWDRRGPPVGGLVWTLVGIGFRLPFPGILAAEAYPAKTIVSRLANLRGLFSYCCTPRNEE